MARNKLSRERVQAVVAALLDEEAAEEEAGRLENIDDIEEAMVRIGDLVAREFGRQLLARHTERVVEHPPCPHCGQAGEFAGKRHRDLVTRRGEVPLSEAKYRCPKCRRHFFPSDRSAGTGGEVRLHATDVSPHRVRRGAGQ